MRKKAFELPAYAPWCSRESLKYGRRAVKGVNRLFSKVRQDAKDTVAGIGYGASDALAELGERAGSKILPELVSEFNKNLDKNMPKYHGMAKELGGSAASGAVDTVNKQLPTMSRTAGDNFIDGALNNKQLHRWLSIGGGGLGGALLLAALMKNKPLALLLGAIGGGFAGNYLHKNWKGDWSKTWDGMKSGWGSK